jgi:ABC-type multidrug transport system permease subunit
MKKNFYGSDLGKLQMHFHTSIRNVGLYLSVSLALLGASRHYRKGSERSRVKQLMFTIVSLAFTTNAFLVSKYLLNDHMSMLKNYSKEETTHVTKWYIIPKILLGTSFLFICFSLYLSLNTMRKIIRDYIYA